MQLMGRAVTTVFLALVPFLFIACPRSEPPPQPRVGMSERPRITPTPAPLAVSFNGERALDHVRKQIEFGPRPPGSPELEKTREYIINELKTAGAAVLTDEFNTTTPLGEKKMVNITAEIPGESKDVLMIASHYESKYFKDFLFVGAYDP
jgi:glutaminyl-peptide cyclotransferase